MPDPGVEVWIKRAEGPVHPFASLDCMIVEINGCRAYKQLALSEALNLAPGECKRFRLCEVEDGE